jgi:biotin transporter BioY
MYADDLKFLVLQFLLPSLAASYFASLICRIVESRHYHLGWWVGLVGTAAACIFVVGFVWLGFFLQPGEDPYHTRRFLCFVCLAGSLLAVIPAGIVVWRYRKNFVAHN